MEWLGCLLFGSGIGGAIVIMAFVFWHIPEVYKSGYANGHKEGRREGIKAGREIERLDLRAFLDQRDESTP